MQLKSSNIAKKYNRYYTFVQFIKTKFKDQCQIHFNM